jgi:CRP-like cAMP-binding protein
MSTSLVEQTAHARRRVAALLEGCPRLELPAGESRSADELPAATLLLVDAGTIALVRNQETAARRLVLALAAPREVLLPPGPDDRLTAVTDARVTAVGDEAYRALLATPEAAATIADLLADAICERERSLETFARFPHVERVRGKLLQLARSHGRVSGRGVLIRLPLTHDLLAGMVGSARETVTWAIRELQEEGFLSREGRLYRLHVPPEEIQGDRDRRRPW